MEGVNDTEEVVVVVEATVTGVATVVAAIRVVVGAIVVRDKVGEVKIGVGKVAVV